MCVHACDIFSVSCMGKHLSLLVQPRLDKLNDKYMSECVGWWVQQIDLKWMGIMTEIRCNLAELLIS